MPPPVVSTNNNNEINGNYAFLEFKRQGSDTCCAVDCFFIFYPTTYTKMYFISAVLHLHYCKP